MPPILTHCQYFCRRLGFKFNAQELNCSSTFSATQFSTVGFQSSGLESVTEGGAAEEVTLKDFVSASKARTTDGAVRTMCHTRNN